MLICYYVVYVSGHAIDRYCERFLHKPGYELTDEELINLWESLVKNGIVEFDKYDNTMIMGIKEGMFLGYINDKGQEIFKTFLIPRQFYDWQRFKKFTWINFVKHHKKDVKIRKNVRH